jgi:GNAT superfamily N-acetyltransferase
MVPELRVASGADAVEVATLLDAFNREFSTPTPGVEVLARRLESLLEGPDVMVLLAGAPAVGVAVISLRANVWYDGPVALLDELYVAPSRRNEGIGSALLTATEVRVRVLGAEVLEIQVDGDDIDAIRFYERHGYANHEPGQSVPSVWYYRELDGSPLD